MTDSRRNVRPRLFLHSMPRQLEDLITSSCEQKDCEKAFVHIMDDMKRSLLGLKINYKRRRALKYFASIILFTSILSILNFVQRPNGSSLTGMFESRSRIPLVVVVTPTYRRTTRLADLTRMANTLMHLREIHWIVVEDGARTYSHVGKLLQRSGIPYTYMAHSTAEGYPRKGWHQRNMAMKYIREHSEEILQGHQSGVLYFGDDDNSYDIRVFDNYIRKVKGLGMWAVGLVGGIAVESPRVVEGKVVGFNVRWNKNRTFAVDMGGFAINLDRILNSTAQFGKNCRRGLGAPETCLLEDLGFKRSDIEPFGIDNGSNKEILVWHTRTKTPTFDPKKVDNYGYIFEFARNDTVGVPVKTKHSNKTI